MIKTNSIKIIKRVAKCSGVKLRRFSYQLIIIISVSVAEGLFVYLLLPFLELFKSDNDSLSGEAIERYRLLTNLLENNGFQPNIYSVGFLE